MKLLKSYTFTWWQIGILKLSLLCVGLAIGAYWHEFFSSYLAPLIVIAVVAALYSWYIALKQ